VTRSDFEVTSFDGKSPGSGCRRVKTCVYCMFDFLQGCSSQEEAVTWQEMASRVLSWPEVTRKWRQLTGSYLEVAVEVQKLAYTMRLTSYKAVARRRRQSCDRKWRHVSSRNRKWRRSDVIWPKSPGSGCRRPKTHVYCLFDFLPGCSSQEEAVTWQEMMSRDLRWPQVTRKWRLLTGSYLEVVVEVRKLAIPSVWLSTRL